MEIIIDRLVANKKSLIGYVNKTQDILPWRNLLHERMRIKYTDYAETINVRRANYLAPNHPGLVVEDCEIVEFSSKAEH